MIEAVLYGVITGMPVALAIILHEIAHGWAALRLGDTTARDMKRLSLNPLRHIDMTGTVILPALLIVTKAPFVFGWAKPVPVDFRRLRHPKRDMIFVALAGPLMNLAQAVVAFAAISVCAHLNVAVPEEAMVFFMNVIVFNLSVMLFNLIPVLPLDGGRVLTGLLPQPLAVKFAKTEKYGFGVMALLLIFLPLLGQHIGYDLDVVSLFLATGVKGIFTVLAGLSGLG